MQQPGISPDVSINTALLLSKNERLASLSTRFSQSNTSLTLYGFHFKEINSGNKIYAFIIVLN